MRKQISDLIAQSARIAHEPIWRTFLDSMILAVIVMTIGTALDAIL